MELNHKEIVSSLSSARDKDAPVELLVALILDLFMEIEALREAVIKIDNRTFETPTERSLLTMRRGLVAARSLAP